MSIDAVARKAGVPVATVAKVLSGAVGAREKAAQGVRRAIAELGYTPQLRQVKGGPVRQKLKRLDIGVISLGAEEHWRKRADVSATLRGIAAATGQSGLQVHVCRSTESLSDHRDFKGAIVFVPSRVSDGEAQKLATRFPLVLLMGANSGRLHVDHISSSPDQVGRMAFGYLASRECAHFAFIMDDAQDETTQLRAQGFSRAAVHAGRSVKFHVIARKRPNVAAFADRPHYFNSMRAAFNRIVDGQTATGVFAPSPALAARLCREQEKNESGNLHVISCDDYNNDLTALNPPPPWLDSQWELIGQMAVRQLIHRIANPSAPAVRVQIPAVLRQIATENGRK